MAKFRKIPVVIEAVIYSPTGPHSSGFHNNMPTWLEQAYDDGVVSNVGKDSASSKLKIKTLEGPMYADQGDWIIRGVKGELYSCKPDIFQLTYEVAE